MQLPPLMVTLLWKSRKEIDPLVKKYYWQHWFTFQDGERVAKLLGVDCADLYKNLLKPRIKVGNEFVTQGRNKDQVTNSVGALCKGMFDRLFKWLVKKCNETLDTKQKRQHFIGVLDIAGFEIFDVSIDDRWQASKKFLKILVILLAYDKKKNKI